MNVYFFIHPFRKGSITAQALNSVKKQSLKPMIYQLPNIGTLLYFMQIYFIGFGKEQTLEFQLMIC